MIWWDRDTVAFADLENGLAKMNRVHIDLHDQYQDYAAALSLFAKGYGWIQHPQAEKEASRIRRYFSDAGQAFLDDEFFDSSPVTKLVELQPLIASEEDIDAARRAKRSMALSDEEWSNARRAHREFVTAAQNFYESRTMPSRQRAARQLGQILWQIRNNLQHGGKSPVGPDHQKAQRDAEVLAVGLPVLEMALNRTLGSPNNKLACYGSLRRGEINHEVIADLGEPLQGQMRGTIHTRDGFPVYRWTNAGDHISVEIYESPLLSDERWEKLKRFEGDGYRAIRVPVRVETGHLVATTYADAH